jgi:hypothetical protein
MLELEGVLIQAIALRLACVLQHTTKQGTRLLLTATTNQRELYQQIAWRFCGHRHYPPACD